MMILYESGLGYYRVFVICFYHVQSVLGGIGPNFRGWHALEIKKMKIAFKSIHFKDWGDLWNRHFTLKIQKMCMFQDIQNVKIPSVYAK